MTAVLPVLVVRNTFLNVEEAAAETTSSCKRSNSAPRSWKPKATEGSPTASTAASCAGSDDEADSGRASDCTLESGDAFGLACADAEGDSDEEFFGRVQTRWGCPQWCSRPFKFNSEAREYDAAPHQATLLKPPQVLVTLSIAIPPEQQAAAGMASPLTTLTPCVRTPLRTKLSGSAQAFNPTTRSAMVAMVPPFGMPPAPSVLESPPAPAALPAPPRMSAAASATLPALDGELEDLLPVDQALRRPSGTNASRNRKGQLKSQKKHARGCVGPAVGAAISRIEGVASVAVSRGVNGLSFTVKVKPGHPHASDSVLGAAKAAVMNASALSTGSYIIGYSNQPFEELPGGFKVSLGVVQECDRASACWSFYENGSCPSRSTCHKQHPKDKDLERIEVTLIS